MTNSFASTYVNAFQESGLYRPSIRIQVLSLFCTAALTVALLTNLKQTPIAFSAQVSELSAVNSININNRYIRINDYLFNGKEKSTAIA